MSKGVIYLMTTVVPGLIKIGKTGSGNFDRRMYNLEHDGYRNVTGLKRAFAIEVEDYDDKEALLHTIFEKSQVSDTELFSLDINIAIQLLSSFEGTVVYPKEENKEQIFEEAAESAKSMLIPDGRYTFKRKKKSDNAVVEATAIVRNGNWKILKGSKLGIHEDKGLSQKAREFRKTMAVDPNGILLEDTELGVCTPSFAGCIVLNQSDDGWLDWENVAGEKIDIYRKSAEED